MLTWKRVRNTVADLFLFRFLLYAVICLSFLSKANITNALNKHKAMRMPQLYINGTSFHNIEGMELR